MAREYRHDSAAAARSKGHDYHMVFEALKRTVVASWPTLGDLAFYGLLTTLIAALAGIGAQLWISYRSARDAERLRRHNELVHLYSDLGKFITRSNYSLATLIKFRKDNTVNPILAPFHARAVTKKFESWVDEFQPAHNIKLLTLHQAGQAVIAAFERWSDGAQEDVPEGLDDSSAKTWWEAKVKRSGEDSTAFYAAAGQHAKAALLGTRHGR
jgi:hypothetical protein